MQSNTDAENPVCPKCKRKMIYFRKDGTIRCTACGYEGKLNPEED